MRPIRLLILLLAVAFALALALQGRATRTARKHGPQVARRVQRPEPRRRLSHPAHAAHAFGDHVVAYARHFLGTPYAWGGATPGTGFDCSGLVRFVYRRFGIRLPHSSWADLSYGRRILRRSLRPGDLVFFYGAGHVGIYAGHGLVLHAPHAGTRVRLTPLRRWSDYWGARRIVRAR